MWSLGLTLGFVTILLNYIAFSPEKIGAGLGAVFLSNILMFIVDFIVGLKGNSWREKNLVSRGFEHVETVTAANSDGAMALYVAGANTQNAAPAAQPSVSNRLQSAG
jgi:hypothetical protein